MRPTPRKGLSAALLLALLACALLPARGQLPPIPGGDPCSASSEPWPHAALAGAPGIRPRRRRSLRGPAHACLSAAPEPAACNYKAIPEPTEPAKYDTGNAGAAILNAMVEGAFELTGDPLPLVARPSLRVRQRTAVLPCGVGGQMCANGSSLAHMLTLPSA